jgi:hypothetical protein
MIWSVCFEKLFEVIGGLPRLMLRIMLGGGDELLVGVASVLVIIALVIAGANYDSSWSPLRHPIIALSTPPCTLIGCLGWRPPTARGHLGAALHEDSPDRFLARGMPSGDVEEFFGGLWLVTAVLVYQGSVVCAGLERRDGIGVADHREFMTVLGEAPAVIPQGFPLLLSETFQTVAAWPGSGESRGRG